MGEQHNGKMLGSKALRRKQALIREKYREALIHRFKQVYPDVEEGESQIISVGVEIEATFLKNYLLAPLLDQIKEIVGEENIGPELVQWLGEVKTKPEDLFSLSTSLEELTNHFNYLLSPIDQAAVQLEGKVALIGGHPDFDLSKAKKWLTKLPRYTTLKKNLDHLAQEIKIPFVGGQIVKRKGIMLEGYGASLQVTIKIPHRLAALYHDASYLSEPIFFALSASSPFVERKATTFDSTRIPLLTAAAYGFPKEEKKTREGGRWRVLEPLTRLSQPKKCWFDWDTYLELRKLGVDDALALYFGTIAGDGHMIISDENLKSGNKKFPQATSWPLAKLQYNGESNGPNQVMDERGMGLELRLGEIMPTVEENASFARIKMAVLQGLVEEMIEGNMFPLHAKDVNQNIEEASLHKPNPDKEMYWHDYPSPTQKPLPDIVEYLSGLAVRVLQHYDHPDHDIRETLNPIITIAGVEYRGNNQFRRIKPQPGPAQRMRKIAYEQQPKTKQGEPLHDETIAAVLEPAIYKPLNP